MKKTLLILLFILAFVMIIIGFNSKMIAPALTGLGFLFIAGLFYTHR